MTAQAEARIRATLQHFDADKSATRLNDHVQELVDLLADEAMFNELFVKSARSGCAGRVIEICMEEMNETDPENVSVKTVLDWIASQQ